MKTPKYKFGDTLEDDNGNIVTVDKIELFSDGRIYYCDCDDDDGIDLEEKRIKFILTKKSVKSKEQDAV